MIFVYLCVVAGAVLILVGILGTSLFGGPRVKLTQDESQASKLVRRSFLYLVCPFTIGLLEGTKSSAKLKDKLDAAHVKLSAVEFFNLKLLVMLSLSVLAFFVLKRLEPVAILACLIFGYMIPDIWLNRKISQHKEKIIKLLPETVDLLGLCVEAGLDFTSALRWVMEKTPLNSMVEELAFVLEEIRWGKPRTQALRDMSRRLQIPEVSSFVQTLVLAERMGTPVAEAFTMLSEDTRLQRYHRGERIAMKAPLKILIPLIFFILPVIGIVIGGPIFLQFMQGKLF